METMNRYKLAAQIYARITAKLAMNGRAAPGDMKQYAETAILAAKTFDDVWRRPPK